MDTPTQVAGAIHGPYEDLFLAGLNLLTVVIHDAPPEVKQKLWSDFLAFHAGLQNFASKVDVFHLFSAKQ
jgi:hypothetical protein